MNTDTLIERINSLVAKNISSKEKFFVLKKTPDHILQIPPEDLPEICHKLKETEPYYFLHLSDITAVDFPEKQKRFQLNYQLFSFKLNYRLELKFSVPENYTVNSIQKIWPGAEIMQQEISKLFGINFSNTSNKQTWQFDPGTIQQPLRKDYPDGTDR